MYYYKAFFQYAGTNYSGFQWQKDIPSVQNEINIGISKIHPWSFTTMGASRTDSGVHAVEQIVKITSEKEISSTDFVSKLNEALPKDILCLSMSACEGSFRPTSGTHSKEYRYLFTNRVQASTIDEDFLANNPYELDIELMKLCAKEIIGTHSFHNFVTSGSNVKTTIREILFCELTEVNPHLVLENKSLFPVSSGITQCFQLRIVGNGFLKHMVRFLMSALWLVGNKRITPDEFKELIHGPMRSKRVWKKAASSRGLYLFKLNYN